MSVQKSTFLREVFDKAKLATVELEGVITLFRPQTVFELCFACLFEEKWDWRQQLQHYLDMVSSLLLHTGQD